MCRTGRHAQRSAGAGRRAGGRPGRAGDARATGGRHADAPAPADAAAPIADTIAPAPDAPVADATSNATAPTQAELDFAAIYGQAPYDPIADPTLPAPAQMPASYDPWEGWNRRVHAFNNAVDRTVATPLARAYVKVVPRPVRLGVSNFFNNLGQPVSALNALLQGRPKQAGQSLGRFLLNSTLGIGGLFDPASDAELPNRSEDFGQTLGVWGWKNSRYVELPLFGPRTLRDTFGLVGDAPLSPLRQVEHDGTRVFLQGLQWSTCARSCSHWIRSGKAPPTSTRWCAMPGCNAATTRSSPTAGRRPTTCRTTCSTTRPTPPCRST